MATDIVGKPIDRVDGRLKVTGAARYAADAPVGATAYAVLVQSSVPSGRVTGIDAAAAEKAPGVLAVLTHLNAPKLIPPKPNFMTGGVTAESRLPLSDDVIHYAGQSVAVVVADSYERARGAARFVKVRYDAQPATIRFDDAKQWREPEQNFGEELQYERGDAKRAIESARAEGVVLEAAYTTPAETHNPMEPSATVAVWEGDRLTIYDATQWIVGVQAIMAEAFGIPRENVHVICPFVGGAFGCKAFIWPHQLLAALAARVVKRPVKLVLTRPQMFTSCGHRPVTQQKLTVAAGRDGKLTAIRHETRTDSNAVSDYMEPCGLASSRMMYAVPNVQTPHKVAVTNVAPPTFMRAPGETPGMFALESAMDELAYLVNRDPLELRRLNHADTFPPTGQPFSSNHLLECYTIGAEKFGWAKRPPQPRAMKDGRWLVGYGMGCARFPGLRWGATARVRVEANGRVVGGSATHDLGTGAYTVFTQVTAQEMGVGAERVTFELGDSKLPPAPVAGGSNSTATVSQAIIAAAANLKSKLAELAVGDAKSPLHGLAADKVSISDGRVFATGEPARGETWTELIARSGQPFVAGEALSVPGAEQAKYAFHSLGAQFCEVRVDEALGTVRVSRVVSVLDVGRILNPKTARSQVLGGVVMGIGMALMEHTVYDSRTARPVTDNFADYAIPVNADIGAIDVHFIDKPDPYINTLGCRGVGEVGITGVAAAIANAVFHATGKRVRDLPITPDKLLVG